MYAHILIPVALDIEHSPEPALRVARRLMAEGGRVTALHVIEPMPAFVAHYLSEDENARRPENRRRRLREALGEAAVECDLVEGHAGRAIVDYAGAHDVDLIIVASHRPDLQDYVLGSTAAQVVRHAQCCVHVLR